MVKVDIASTSPAKKEGILLKGSNFLSDWFFAYVYRIGAAARRLTAKELKFRLDDKDASRTNAKLILDAWSKALDENQGDAEKISVARVLIKVYGWDYSMIGFYKFFWGVFTWLAAYYFLKETVLFVQNKSADSLAGHMWALALLLAALFSSIAIHQMYAECNRMSIRVRSAISALVYQKSLRLSRIRGGAGEVINILSSDMTRVVDCIVNFHFLWSAFIECAAILAISFYEIGLSALPALGFVLILLPVQMYLGKTTAETNRIQTTETTDRVQIMSEILTAIKLIKFYAWEKPFHEKVEGIRDRELGAIFRQMMVKTINYAVVFSIPVLIALCSLAMYVYTGNTLTAAVSFSVLSVFNTLRYPFFMLPLAVRGIAGARSAMTRLNDFLRNEEVEKMAISKNPSGDDTAFEINNCDFKWDGAEGMKPTLKNISLQAKRGQKIAVIGDVGSGKSSLIAALLGQIRQVSGEKLKVYGTTSYVPQQAWLLNTTLRDNITFGETFDKVKYKEVVRVCSLQRDLTLLLAGDMTEIAERGANLSGGQRQRTSLARAVYHDCEIVLLDDPLSAVDQHVGSHIFNECFLKHLGDKTVIMAIHQLQYLEQLDWIVMMKDGEIEKQGTYADLIKYEPFKYLIDRHVAGAIEIDLDVDDEPEVMNDGDFELPEVTEEQKQQLTVQVDPKTQHSHADLSQLSYSERAQLTVRKNMELNEKTVTSMIERHQLTISKGENVAKTMAENELSVYGVPEGDDYDEERGKLVLEDRSTDTSTMTDFRTYLRSASGTIATILIFLMFPLVHLIRIGSDYWLRLWIPRVGGFSDAVYLGVYGGCVFFFATGAFLRGYFFSVESRKKSNFFHAALFKSVMRAPMSFFDATPLGRILSTFSKHIMTVDDSLSDSFFQALQYSPLGLGALILCAVIVPWNWAPVIGLCVLAYIVVKMSAPSEEKTKAMDAITKPAIFAHLTCTLEGLFSIRAYHAENRFTDIMMSKLDTNHENLLAMLLVKSWIALNLDILSSFVVYFTALLVIIYGNTTENASDAASVAGLALSNALQMLVFVQWTVRMLGDAMSLVSAVGQVNYYGTQIDSEAPAIVPDNRPRESWPEKGQINFRDIGLRYTEYGVKVLKEINFTIYPTEKIGIVGRTGSGKSTLLISFLRIVEACEGRMTIDGVDISKIGLEDLRKKIAIIPQEPVLFKGTVRSNLDPFHNATDQEIWDALNAVHLGKVVGEMPSKLDSAVIENGKNFSLGQRQMFCIARAILSKTKILVLDEATANVSPETDMLIQETIRKNFKDMTVLTIAHRINTIIDSDRVMLLDAGRILEFDDPVTLLETKGGSFKDLVDKTGPSQAKKLYEMAVEAQSHRTKKIPEYVEPAEKKPTSDKLDIKALAAGKH